MGHIEHMNGIQLGLSLSTEQIRNLSVCLIQFYKKFSLSAAINTYKGSLSLAYSITKK